MFVYGQVCPRTHCGIWLDLSFHHIGCGVEYGLQGLAASPLYWLSHLQGSHCGPVWLGPRFTHRMILMILNFLTNKRWAHTRSRLQTHCLVYARQTPHQQTPPHPQFYVSVFISTWMAWHSPTVPCPIHRDCCYPRSQPPGHQAKCFPLITSFQNSV